MNTRDDDGCTLLHFFCDFRPPGVEEIVLLRLGADETIPSVGGRAPIDSLDFPQSAHFSQCSQGTFEHVLARAPVDRAWRRQCWLVMLRSRVSRACGAASHTGDEKWGGPIFSVKRENEGCEEPKMENARQIERAVLGQQANKCSLDAVAAKDGRSKELRGVVTVLVGLELGRISHGRELSVKKMNIDKAFRNLGERSSFSDARHTRMHTWVQGACLELCHR